MQRHRKTDRQRDRETEIQTERQKDRDTETERQRYKGGEGVVDMFATCVGCFST